MRTIECVDFRTRGGIGLGGEEGLLQPPLGRSAAPFLLPDQPLSRKPIWLAALVASGCKVKAGELARGVRWSLRADRALYTNAGTVTERIEPFDVVLMPG